MMQTNIQTPAWGKALVVSLLLAALLAVSLMLAGKPTHAATTFTVNRTDDFQDPDPGDGECGFFSGRGGRACSLRAAIQEANATPGADAIEFGIGGTGLKSIAPASELPRITDTVTIDGYSQPDSSVNTLEKGTNAVLNVQLDGIFAGSFSDGLQLGSGASDSIVKGLVIKQFSGHGIEISDATGVRVEGNFIGTDASGTLNRGNRLDGVLVGGDFNTVGGTLRFQRNLISGNAEGVQLNSDAEDNEVQGNLIGTQKDGTSPLGNDFLGVAVRGADNFVGDFSPGDANTIAFNGQDGVLVGSGTGNRILSNSIFSNDGLGIDLQGGIENAVDATSNDPGDPDAGPNDLQNKPVITSATTSGGTTTIQARLNSAPSDPYLIQFFSNASGNEGKKFIGSKSVSTNSDGNVTFSFTPSQAVAAGQKVTATALDVVNGNTSEFSAPSSVVAS